MCTLLVYCRCVKVGSESVSTDNFLVLTCLGWLFEVLVYVVSFCSSSAAMYIHKCSFVYFFRFLTFPTRSSLNF